MTPVFNKIEHPAVFGATGSLGTCVCRVLAADGIECAHIGGFRGHDRLSGLLEGSGAKTVSFEGAPSIRLAAEMTRLGVARVDPENALVDAGSAIIVSAGLDGAVTLKKSVELGLPVAVGNKETLVGWGRMVMGPIAAKAGGCDMRPVDSEHASLSVLLNKIPIDAVSRVVLTGTGGAVRDTAVADRACLPPEKVLRHPVWRMGAKITVDSATLMNKAFEIIEACILFGLPADTVTVMFDRHASVHAAIETIDGHALAFKGPANMETPVRIALGMDIPQTSRTLDGSKAMDAVAALRRPDKYESRALALGYQAAAHPGTLPLALVVADDIAVRRYLAGSLMFGDIIPFLETVIDRMNVAEELDPESEADLEKTVSLTADAAIASLPS